MDKFLYITDHQKNAESSFAGALFEKYLNEHFDTSILYFSKTLENFEIANERT